MLAWAANACFISPWHASQISNSRQAHATHIHVAGQRRCLVTAGSPFSGPLRSAAWAPHLPGCLRAGCRPGALCC